MTPLRGADLRPVEAADTRLIHEQLAEILRHNNISDRENAFNRVISLFLCKVVDEGKGEDDVLDFQWREGADTPEDLQDRLQRLYHQGMAEHLHEDVVYYSDEDVRHAFRHHKRSVAEDAVLAMVRELKFYTNNEFAFRRVHNRKLFEQNAKVLMEVVKLLQPYRIRHNRRDQFLGDLFELLLNDGVKQSEGQFFTPLPITEFLVACLPWRSFVQEHHRLPRVLDYACGSGHFLTESIAALQAIAAELDRPEATSTAWTRDHVFGVERDYRLARVAKVACFMNGAGETNVVHGDGLAPQPRLDLERRMDTVVANPPYSIKGFKQHLRVDNDLSLLDSLGDGSSEIEYLFVERTAQVLADGGVATVILPTSILSNPKGPGLAVRELLLRRFHIRGIVELPGSTFIATGTTTAVLFLQRRSDDDATHAEYRAAAVYDHEALDDDEFDDGATLDTLAAALDLSPADYRSLIARAPNPALQQSDLWVEHLAAFESDRTEQAARKRIAKEGAEAIRDAAQDRLIDFALARERRRFTYFQLADGPSIPIARSRPGKENERTLLGYKWSQRRGAQGLQPTGDGLLYHPDAPDDLATLRPWLRASLAGAPLQDPIPDALDGILHLTPLRALIEWDLSAPDLRISTRLDSAVREATNYPLVRFAQVGRLEYGSSLKKADRRPGDVPVVGSNGPDGVHDESKVEGPVVIVGRKGSAGKVTYVDRDCWPIDTTFYLRSDLDPVYATWLLKWLELERLASGKGVGVPGLNRGDVHRSRVPDVPAADQVTIAAELAAVDDGRKDADAQRLAVMERWLVG